MEGFDVGSSGGEEMMGVGGVGRWSGILWTAGGKV